MEAYYSATILCGSIDLVLDLVIMMWEQACIQTNLCKSSHAVGVTKDVAQYSLVTFHLVTATHNSN